MTMRRRAMIGAAAVGLAAAVAGLGPAGAGRVVVYAATDQEFSEPILKDYQAATGTAVLAKYDVESTKTVSLRQAIEAEKGRPRCDLFWNNEIVNTLRLKQEGLLQPFRPEGAENVPAQFRAKDGTWYGFAGRARILLVNTELVADAERPDSLLDLADPKWKGRIGLAKPLFGTTATQAVCLFETWGDARARDYFRDLKANGARVYSGNRQVAQAVGSGAIAFGLTDTDDATLELEAGSPVAIVYPDRRADQMGTLFIPNTLAVIKGCPDPEAAEALASYLLSPEVEARLARGSSAQIPLNPAVGVPPRIETPRTVKPMPVDFEAAARRWDDVMRFLAAEFAAS